MKHIRLWKNVILWAIYWREISPLVVTFAGGLLDVTTNIYLKSCAYHPDSECCTFFHGNLSDLKCSEDTLLYLYVIYNMLKSAELHETILTPVICNKHVRCHDGVTLYFSVKFLSVVPKKTRNGHFSIYQQISRILSKNNQKKKKKGEREKNFDWTFVNTYMKTLTIQKSIIWSERPYDRP